MTTESLVKSAPGALVNVPEYLRKNVGNQAGLENVTKDDVLIPRLCISQGLSPQCTKGDAQFIKGLQVGEFFNSLTGEIYGERVNVVPLFFFTQFIEFVPRKEGGGIVAQYAKREEVPTGDLDFVNGEKPKVTEFKNEMCLIVHEDGRHEPIVVSFKSTGMKVAKKWNALMRQLNLPAYSRMYTLDITTLTNAEGTWYGSNVTPSEFVPEEFFAQAETYFKQLRESGIRVDTAGLGDDPATSDGDTSF